MTSRLRAVPDTPPRMIGMIRVSKEREDMVSPELQWTAIQDHCTRRAYQLLDLQALGLADQPFIVGLDESGSRRNSQWWAKLDRGVELIEQGHADGIIVWRFSRTARQRLKWAVAIDRVEVAGGVLESATEPLDTTTPSGRLARGMLAEMAAYEAEVIGSTWKEAHARRTRQGLPANGKPRFGYRYVDKKHVPDSDTGPVLAELYRRYVAGESMYGLAAWLNTEGILPVAGYHTGPPRPWSGTSVRHMLDTGFGAGFITVHATRQPGAHAPVIDSGTWAAYLAAREARRTHRRGERSTSLLTSIVWCGHCGERMGTYRHSTNKRPMVKCYSTNRPAGPRHTGAYVYQEPIEQAVWDWIEQRASELDASADAHIAARAYEARRKQDAATLTRQVVEIDKAIGRLIAQQAQLPEIAYRAGLDELMGQRAMLEARRVRAEADAHVGEPARIAADLVEHRDVYSVERARALLRQLVARIVVTGQGSYPAAVKIDPV